MRGAMVPRPSLDNFETPRDNNEGTPNNEEIRLENISLVEETPLTIGIVEKDSKDADFPLPDSPYPNNPVTQRVDVNVYSHKKTLAQGMMDLALLSANANQLRYVLDMGGTHPYYYPSLVLISTSLFLQIAVGVGLILNSQYNIKKDTHMHRANRINNFTMIGIFLVTIINVFISAFSISTDMDPPKLPYTFRDGQNETMQEVTERL